MVIGGGEQRPHLEKKAADLGVSDRVEFRGHVSDEELREAYLACDVFCQPGTAELQSLVTLEALSASTEKIDGLHVNVAVGYGGRREIVDAVKELMHDAAGKGMSLDALAEELTDQHISSFLYTRGQQDPDLVIRTSGEQRLSGFLMWQSAYSEFYFCEALWPDFRRVDFLRALRDFGRRQRRFGS